MALDSQALGLLDKVSMNKSASDSAGARTRFKFKSRRSSLEPEDKDRNANKFRNREYARQQTSHSAKPDGSLRHKRRKLKHGDHTQPTDARKDSESPGPCSDPDVAFREALFDAMADDEGAAYWESVYDQPIHIYSNTRPGPDGELERMTDEEYTAFVRAKMYEKTHEHLIAERERREEIRKREREQRRQQKDPFDPERHSFQTRMEESLRRGEQRRAQKQWKEVWDKYLRTWEYLVSGVSQESEDGKTKARWAIPWPVKSGRLYDVNREAIETFFRNAPESGSGGSSWQGLKTERIRWHPDKMQQRFGSERLDEKSVRAVTAVFQVIDRMYNDSRVTGSRKSESKP